jgi:hypothetical protein
VTDQQNPIDKAVDLLVFAPIGVAMFAKDTVPTFVKMFVARGQTEIEHQRKHLRDQAHQYRTVGRFAWRYGAPEVRRQAEETLDGARRRAEQTFAGLVVPRVPATYAPTPAPTEPAANASNGNGTRPFAPLRPVPTVPAEPQSSAAATARRDTRATPDKHATPDAPDVASLPIPDYDELSASQVVERLDGLASDELNAVRAYETAHRGRNTILGKLAQLED